MIDHLQGELIARAPDHLVVRSQGLGFRVEIPTGTFASVLLGELVTLPTVLLLRQDAIALFGFSTATEREFFHLLTGITGIGPKIALGILGHSPPAALAEAILNEDITGLTQVKGIGKKGARRIVVELSEKIRKMRSEGTVVSSASNTDLPLFEAQALEEAREVLLSLGCREEEAELALREAQDGVDLSTAEAAEQLIMKALKLLGS